MLVCAEWGGQERRLSVGSRGSKRSAGGGSARAGSAPIDPIRVEPAETVSTRMHIFKCMCRKEQQSLLWWESRAVRGL